MHPDPTPVPLRSVSSGIYGGCRPSAKGDCNFCSPFPGARRAKQRQSCKGKSVVDPTLPPLKKFTSGEEQSPHPTQPPLKKFASGEQQKPTPSPEHARRSGEGRGGDRMHPTQPPLKKFTSGEEQRPHSLPLNMLVVQGRAGVGIESGNEIRRTVLKDRGKKVRLRLQCSDRSQKPHPTSPEEDHLRGGEYEREDNTNPISPEDAHLKGGE